MRKFLFLLLLACKDVDPYIVSGTSLNELGQSFLLTADGFKSARDNGLISALEYEKWKEFGERFQKLYPVAVQLWITAVEQKNESAAAQMRAVLESLSGELGIFIQMLTPKPQPKKQDMSGWRLVDPSIRFNTLEYHCVGCYWQLPDGGRADL